MRGITYIVSCPLRLSNKKVKASPTPPPSPLTDKDKEQQVYAIGIWYSDILNHIKLCSLQVTRQRPFTIKLCERKICKKLKHTKNLQGAKFPDNFAFLSKKLFC